MGAITDQDGNVAQVTPDGRLYVLIDGTVTATDVYVKRVDGTRIDPATEGTLVSAGATLVSILAAVDQLEGYLDTVETKLQAIDDDLDSEAAFRRALKFEPKVGEEIRRDEGVTDDYHGVAPDGTATSSASWSVVRFYKTAGLITRVRYRTGVAWDSRTAGW